MLKKFLLLLLIFLWPLSTLAQDREYKPGLNYTTFGGFQKPEEEKAVVESKEPEQSIAEESESSESPEQDNTLSETEQPEKPAKPKRPSRAAAPLAYSSQNTEDASKEEVRIWNKYKALAAGGTAEDTLEKKTKTLGKTKKPEKASGSTVKTIRPKPLEADRGEGQPTPAHGIASVLEDWHASKNEQREMRSLHFEVPQGADKEAPEVEEKSTDETAHEKTKQSSED